MKKILIALCLLICSVAVVFAANPSGYPSLHGDLGRAGAPDKEGTFYFPTVVIDGETPMARVFVPPGALYLYLVWFEYDFPEAIARHKKPPTNPTLPSTIPASSPSVLSIFQSSDQHLMPTKGKLQVFNSSVLVSAADCGWFYVSVGGGNGTAGIRHVQYMIVVDASEYNTWYDSIRWPDIENVTTYGPALPPDPTVTPGPTPPPIDPVPNPARCDAFSCLLEGKKCVNNECVEVVPTPIPTPVPLPTMFMTILQTDIKIIMTSSSAGIGTATVKVGDSIYSDIPYTITNLELMQ